MQRAVILHKNNDFETAQAAARVALRSKMTQNIL
jgi:hypothetical protein